MILVWHLVAVIALLALVVGWGTANVARIVAEMDEEDRRG